MDVLHRIAVRGGEAWIPDTPSFAPLGRRSGMTKVGAERRATAKAVPVPAALSRVIPEDEARCAAVRHEGDGEAGLRSGAL